VGASTTITLGSGQQRPRFQLNASGSFLRRYAPRANRPSRELPDFRTPIGWGEVSLRKEYQSSSLGGRRPMGLFSGVSLDDAKRKPAFANNSHQFVPTTDFSHRVGYTLGRVTNQYRRVTLSTSPGNYNLLCIISILAVTSLRQHQGRLSLAS